MAFDSATRVDQAELARLQSEGGDKTRKEILMLVLALRGKPVEADDAASKVLLTHITTVKAVVNELLGDPTKANAALAVIQGQSATGLLAMSRKSETSKRKSDLMISLNDEPNFDPCFVKTFGDIPDPWCWGVLKKASKKTIEQSVIQQMSKKSGKPMRLVMYLLTGFHDKYPITGHLLVKNCLSHVMLTQITDRGDQLNAEENFLENLVDGTQFVMSKLNAVGFFSFVAKDEDPQMANKVKNNLTGEVRDLDAIESGMQVSMKKEIEQNVSMTTAHFKVFKQNKYIWKFFMDDKNEYDKQFQETVDASAEAFARGAKSTSVTIDVDLISCTKRQRVPKGLPKAALCATSTLPIQALTASNVATLPGIAPIAPEGLPKIDDIEQEKSPNSS